MGKLLRSLVVLVGCSAIACTPGETVGGGGGGGGSDLDSGGQPGAPDARAGGGGFIDASGGGGNEFADAMPDANCGVQEEEIVVVNNPAPPDLLIVLDRSGSMEIVLDLTFQTKWQVMRNALKSLTSARDENIRFGLAVFPTDSDCGVSSGTEVAIDDLTAPAIASWLDNNAPDGSTPAQFGLQQALATFNSLPVNPNGRYVLYATDGDPNCDDGGPNANDAVIAAITSLRGQGIFTFVIGYGFLLDLPLPHLNDAAQAGGVPRPDASANPYYYYKADSAVDLEAALEEISGGIIEVSCEYALAELPPEPEAVTVTIDGVPVPRDTNHGAGWDYAPDQGHITFFGSYCDQIKSGSSGSVKFSYGCPGPVVN